jgi:hypothetical protein
LRWLSRVIALLPLAVGPVAAVAHHSNAEFDFDVIAEYEGEVVDVSWRNPHVRLTLRTEREDGSEEIWELEGQAANTLGRRGLSPDLIQEGDIVRVAGHPSKRRSSLYLLNLLLASGTEIQTRGDAEPRWPVDRLGFSRAAIEATPATQGDATGIFRVWTPVERVRNEALPLSDEARAAKVAWDSVTDDPQLGCQPLGMPGVMYSPHPVEFVDGGEEIVLRLEEWDHTRRIAMNRTLVSDDEPVNLLGSSAGRWDGDTLVVTTRNIDFPYMDEFGTPQSEAAELVERFKLTEDERFLDWTATVTDPVTLTEPVVAFTIRWEWLPGEQIQPYDCAVR